MSAVLQTLMNKQWLYRGQQPTANRHVRCSGYELLDEKLQGGWPQYGLVDIQLPYYGIGELQLLMPTLSREKSEDLLVFLNPPSAIYPPALVQASVELEQCLVITPNNDNDSLWAAEQCLRSGCCHTLVMWHQGIKASQARRLQLAAKQGQCLLIMFNLQSTTEQQPDESLPVVLRLALQSKHDGLEIEVVKHQGYWPKAPFTLALEQLFSYRYGLSTLIKKLQTPSNTSALTQTTQLALVHPSSTSVN